jgi:hypothetical protein
VVAAGCEGTIGVHDSGLTKVFAVLCGRLWPAWFRLIWAQAVVAYSADIIACPKVSALHLMSPGVSAAITGSRLSCSTLEVRLVLVNRPDIRAGACPQALGARAAGEPSDDLGRPVETVALYDPVASEHVLGLGVGAVGHH